MFAWGRKGGYSGRVPESNASAFSRAAGAELLARYKKAGWSQERLSAETGIKYTTLRRIISGRAEMDLDQLGRICAVINVDPLKVIDVALDDIGGLPALMSEVASIQEHLAPVTPIGPGPLAEEATEEIEQLEAAATTFTGRDDSKQPEHPDS